MNKKGITMISLVFYVLSFFVVVGVISSITTYVLSNSQNLEEKTQSVYSENKIDKYLRKFLNRKDKYTIISDGNISNCKYIVFTSEDTINNIIYENTIRYYPIDPDVDSPGIIFLEVKENSVVTKMIPIISEVGPLNIIETESGLGIELEFTLNTITGKLIKLNYVVER